MEIHLMSNKSQMNSSTCIFRPKSLWGIWGAYQTQSFCQCNICTSVIVCELLRPDLVVTFDGPICSAGLRQLGPIWQLRLSDTL